MIKIITFFGFFRLLLIKIHLNFCKYNKKTFKKLLLNARADRITKEDIESLIYRFSNKLEENTKDDMLTLLENTYNQGPIFLHDSTWSHIKSSISNLWLFDILSRANKNAKYGIKNIISWLPLIWSDRDWDYVYLYKIMRKKLQMMSFLHEHESHTENNMERVNEMNECIEILDRLMNDEYDKELLDEIEKKYGATHTEFVENKEKMGSILTFKKENNMEVSRKETEEKRNAYIVASLKRKRDLNDLFKIMRDNIESWWD